MTLEKLSPSQATEKIRKLAHNLNFDLHASIHALDQMQERDLLVGDALDILKKGFVYEDAEPASQDGYWKYKMIGITPNSYNREVAVIVIPDFSTIAIKLVTIFWVDEN